jgi:hypothetical protein
MIRWAYLGSICRSWVVLAAGRGILEAYVAHVALPGAIEVLLDLVTIFPARDRPAAVLAGVCGTEYLILAILAQMALAELFVGGFVPEPENVFVTGDTLPDHRFPSAY